MNKLKKCPCCDGDAEWVSIKTKGDDLWQIACKKCDIASCIDDDRIFCFYQWNRRSTERTLKLIINTLTVASPLLLVFGFILGFFLGLRTIG